MQLQIAFQENESKTYLDKATCVARTKFKNSSPCTDVLDKPFDSIQEIRMIHIQKKIII